MHNLDSHNKTIAISQVKKNDVIEYGNDSIETGLFVVFDVSIDEKIPAMILQLWKFDGGYDHSFANVMETDFSLNRRVNYYIPQIIKTKIIEIQSYRKAEMGLSEKEQFFFDLWPNEVSNIQSEEFSVPFKATCEIDHEIREIILTTWTPLQKVPTERINKGSLVELWLIENIYVLMRVVKL